MINNLDLAIQRIKDQDQECDSRSELALNSLMWITTAKQPLTVAQLQHALATSESGFKEDDMAKAEFLVESCLGLVTVDEETSVIRIVHMSINEYLQDRRTSLFENPEETLAMTCLSYFTNIDSDTKSSGKFENFWSTLPLLEYAFIYWGVHAAASFGPEVERVTKELLQSAPSLMFWNRGFHDKAKIAVWDPPDHDETPHWVFQLHLAAVFGIQKLAEQALRDGNLNLDWPDCGGRTAMMIAAAHGHTTILQLLASRTESFMNTEDSVGKTALWYAVRHTQVSTVDLLLTQEDLDVNLANPLLMLCDDYLDTEEAGQVAKLLLAREDIDTQSTNKIFYRIAGNWRLEIVEMLLTKKDLEIDEGQLWEYYNYAINTDYFGFRDGTEIGKVVAIVNLLESDGRFPLPDETAIRLMWAPIFYAFSEHIEPVNRETSDHSAHVLIDWLGIWDEPLDKSWRRNVRSFLESRGIGFDLKDSKNRTLLHGVARSGSPEHVKFFLERLATEIDTPDSDGKTPLHFAVHNENIECIEMLINAGASLDARDETGRSILHFAVHNENIECIEMLINAGASLDTRDETGRSVLHAATASNKFKEVLEILLQAGINIDVVDDFNCTALEESVRMQKPEACRVLIARGADPNISAIGGPPLCRAAQYRDNELLKALLSYERIDTEVFDSFGLRPLDYIASYEPFTIEFKDALKGHVPIHPHVRTRYLLDNLRERIDIVIHGSEAVRATLTYRLGVLLLALGDEAPALVPFETDISTSKQESSIKFKDGQCDCCYTDTEALSVCKACLFVQLCNKCRASRPAGKLPWCKGHNFLEVPGPDWRTLPDGVVNKKGQTYDEFLEELQERYREGSEECRRLLQAVSPKERRGPLGMMPMTVKWPLGFRCGGMYPLGAVSHFEA